MNEKSQVSNFFTGATAVVTLVVTIGMLVLSVAYIAYRLAGDRAYREKWKDYNDCGVA